MNPHPGVPPTTGLLINVETSWFPYFMSWEAEYLLLQATSMPHLVTVYDYGMRVSYYQDPPRVPFYIDIHPEAGYDFAFSGAKLVLELYSEF